MWKSRDPFSRFFLFFIYIHALSLELAALAIKNPMRNRNTNLSFKQSWSEIHCFFFCLIVKGNTIQRKAFINKLWIIFFIIIISNVILQISSIIIWFRLDCSNSPLLNLIPDVWFDITASVFEFQLDILIMKIASCTTKESPFLTWTIDETMFDRQFMNDRKERYGRLQRWPQQKINLTQWPENCYQFAQLR